MTESEWMTSTDPEAMAQFLVGKASDRKLRLFGFACIRRFWQQLPDDRLRRAIEVSELHADGLATDAELGRAVTDANRGRPKGSWLASAAYDIARYHRGQVSASGIAAAAASIKVPRVPPTHVSYFKGDRLITEEVPMNPARWAWNRARDSESAVQCELLRDIFRNPFNQVTLGPWSPPPTVASLAQTIYQQWTFDQMPVLGEVMGRDGCYDQRILEHCRSKTRHVRGCWVIDLLLRKQ